jgi:hypothetical protein
MNAAKTTIAVMVLVFVVAVVLGDGYLKTRRADQHALKLKASVSSLSIQELARRTQECDSSQLLSAPVKHDAAYCAEVMRAIDDRPLEIVDIRR